MTREVLTVKFKQKKRRAFELYDRELPFHHRVEKDRKRDANTTKPKHRNAWRDEIDD